MVAHEVEAALDVSILALHTEGDDTVPAPDALAALFLSSPSIRRATEAARAHEAEAVFLSSPSIRRATTPATYTQLTLLCVSILALHTEGDFMAIRWITDGTEFLSSPSIRRATFCTPSAACTPPFLSSPSIRRATTELASFEGRNPFLSSPSIRRATR